MPNSRFNHLKSTETKQSNRELKDLLQDRDITIFEKKKEIIFEKISQPYPDSEDDFIRSMSKGILVSRVMQHDLEDGLLLAEKTQ